MSFGKDLVECAYCNNSALRRDCMLFFEEHIPYWACPYCIELVPKKVRFQWPKSVYAEEPLK